MVKKLLFILFLLSSVIVFSQEKSIDKLIASPNPFVNSTTISFQSSQKQEVFFMVKNVLGRTVYNKVIRVVAGNNTIPFEKNDLKSGMYIYAVQTANQTLSKRFVIK